MHNAQSIGNPSVLCANFRILCVPVLVLDSGKPVGSLVPSLLQIFLHFFIRRPKRRNDLQPPVCARPHARGGVALLRVRQLYKRRRQSLNSNCWSHSFPLSLSLPISLSLSPLSLSLSPLSPFLFQLLTRYIFYLAHNFQFVTWKQYFKSMANF